MRLITWNINSVRLRIGMVEHLLDTLQPDILCLQETKVVDEDFPCAPFSTRGYIHQHIHGMKSYNGVAILSRLPLAQPKIHHWQEKEDRRHISAILPNGTELHCCYVPAGGDIPDPEANPKFAHKLGFMEEQTRWWKKRKGHSSILVGDLNVAPLEHDVWSHKQMLGVVSHTPLEVEKYTAWQKAFGGIDVLRHFVPAHEKLYSWWSYRAADWVASNRGRRLDHIWVTPDLAPKLKSAHVIRDARGWEPKPSDHVPVVMDWG